MEPVKINGGCVSNDVNVKFCPFKSPIAVPETAVPVVAKHP